MAEIAARCRRDAMTNPHAQVSGEFDVDALLAEEPVRAPLRKHDLPPITDGACAVVIARAERAKELCERPAWITGFAHCAELHYPGMRDLLASESARLAAKAAGVDEAPIEVAEVQAAFTHEEPVLVEALGLGGDVAVNPSGGPLAANPIMATGLVRIAEAAARSATAARSRTLGHSTSGPCLQQNLVCVLEGDAEHESSHSTVCDRRHRPDAAQVASLGRLARRIGARGGDPSARRCAARLVRHRGGRAGQGAGPVRGRDEARAVSHRRAGRARQADVPRPHRRLCRWDDRDRRQSTWSNPVATSGCWPSRTRSSPRATPSSRSAPAAADRSAPVARSRRTCALTSTARGHRSTSARWSRSRTGSTLSKNPYAHLKLADITIESVKASPMMWDPVHYLESCPSSDGACAVVFTDAPAAKRPPHRDVRRRGSSGQPCDPSPSASPDAIP